MIAEKRTKENIRTSFCMGHLRRMIRPDSLGPGRQSESSIFLNSSDIRFQVKVISIIHAVSMTRVLFAGVPLGAGDLVAGNAADDSFAVVDGAAVLGAVAQREFDVLAPLVGLVFLVLGGALRLGRFRAGNQAMIDGSLGLRFAVVAAG